MLISFRHATRGVATLVATQPNARIHLAMTAAIGILGSFLDLSPGDWCWLVSAAAMVWTAEAMNTAVELLGDVACGGEPHPIVGRAKDVAAAGVLLAAMGAALIGVIILLPPVVENVRR